MALKLSLLLQAVDRISAPVRRVQESVKRMGDGVERAARKVDRASAPMSRLGGKVDALKGKMLGMLVAANRAAGPNGLDLLGKASDKAGYAVGRLLGKMGGLAVGAAKWGATAGAAAGGFAIFDMFKTAGQFEQIEIALEGITGSSANAEKAMAWIQQFAAKTPYQLQEVALGFKGIKGLGLDPLDGSLRSVGDAASGTAVELDKGVQALGDAMSGEFERLKEFNIVARQSGDEVTFSYIKNGKRIERTAKKTELALKDAVLASFDEMYGGGMERQSRSLFGLLNSLADKWTEFQLKVADVGVFEKVKARVDELLARIEKMAKNGELDAWAEKVGKKLEEAFDWAWEFANEINWTEVGGTIKVIAEAFWDVTKGLAEAIRLATKLVGIIRNIPSNPAMSVLGPLQPIIGLTSLAKSAMKYGGQQPKERSYGRVVTEGGERDLLKTYRPGMARPMAAPRPRLPNSPSANAVNVGGKASILVEVRGAATARVSDVTKKGDVPWSIQIARNNFVPS